MEPIRVPPTWICNESSGQQGVDLAFLSFWGPSNAEPHIERETLEKTLIICGFCIAMLDYQRVSVLVLLLLAV